MSDNPGGSLMEGSGLKLGGVNFPRWAIYAGAGGLVLALLFLKKKASPEEDGGTQPVTGVTDTGTGMLAAEFDQRLREQWEAWQAWVQDFLNEGQGVVTPPGGQVIVGPPVYEDNPCALGDLWDGVRCISPGSNPGTSVIGNTNPCAAGEIWDGMNCQSVVQREDTTDITAWFCPPNQTRDPNGNCVNVSVTPTPATTPPTPYNPPDNAACPQGDVLTPYGCVRG